MHQKQITVYLDVDDMDPMGFHRLQHQASGIDPGGFRQVYGSNTTLDHDMNHDI